MKKSIPITILFTCLVVLLSSCGVAYHNKKAELMATSDPSDWGPPPSEDQIETGKDYITARLKDPDSAKFKEGKLTRDIIQKSFASPNPILVWVYEIQVNAKNSYGGYTGYKPFYFAWSQGALYAFGKTNKPKYGKPTRVWSYIK